MKRNLFLTMLVVAAILGSCKKEDDKNGGTSTDRFEFREATVTLAIGDSTRLMLVDDQKANDYVWSSSDTAVVVVLDDKGNVKAKKEGVAIITVVSGERKAQCKVLSKPWLEALKFPLAIVWDVDLKTLDSIPDTTVVRESGTYNCVWGIAEIMLTSEGLYWGNDGNLTGAAEGVMMTVHAPVLYDSVQHVQFVLGDYEIVPKADYANGLHTAPGGYYEEAYKRYSEIAAKDYIALEYYGDTTVVTEMVTAWQYMALCPYASMDYYYYEQGETEETSGYYSSYAPTGIVNTGAFELDANESLKYMCSVTYANINAAHFENSFWGWAVTNDELAENVEDLTFEWEGPVAVTYSHGTPSTKNVKELRVPVIKRDYPQMAAQMEKAMSLNKLHRK